MTTRAARANASPPKDKLGCTCGLAETGMAYGIMADCPEHCDPYEGSDDPMPWEEATWD